MSDRVGPGFRAGGDPWRLVRSAVAQLRSVPGRLRFALSSDLDAKPEELIDAALRHARRFGRTPVCVAASFPLTTGDIEDLAGEPGLNAIVSKHDPAGIRLLREEVPSANLGAFWEPGRWLLPDGAVHVYFVGSWRLVTIAMLREALRQQLLTLTVRCGREWVDIPLNTIRHLAAGRRFVWGLQQSMRVQREALRSQLVRLICCVSWTRIASIQRFHIGRGRLMPRFSWSRIASIQRFHTGQLRLMPRFKRSWTVSFLETVLDLGKRASPIPGRLRPRSGANSPAPPGANSLAPSGANLPAPSARSLIEPNSGGVRPFDASMLTDMIRAARQDWLESYVPGRVLLICGNLQPGGAERQVAYTAGGLARGEAIESVQLLCDMLAPDHPARYDFYRPLLERAGVEARVVERDALDRAMVGEPDALVAAQASFPEGLLLDVANLYKEFVRLRPEIVHAWLDWSNTRAGLAAALAGVPRILLSGRNLNPTHFSLYQPYMDPVYQALHRLPNVRFLNNSRAGAESYAAWLGMPADRIKVIYNGLDMARIEGGQGRVVRMRLGIPADAPLIGGVFRFNSEKRPLLWVEVAARVAQAHDDAWFVVFGQGALHAEMEKTARTLGIADRLVMPGIIDDVLPAMQALDVFLLTSYGEGVPNVVLEAQWAGTPVVATNAGGVAEAMDLGKSGWVVDPADPALLADRVSWLLRHPEAKAVARIAGPALVSTRFGMRRMVEETLQAYGLA